MRDNTVSSLRSQRTDIVACTRVRNPPLIFRMPHPYLENAKVVHLVRLTNHKGTVSVARRTHSILNWFGQDKKGIESAFQQFGTTEERLTATTFKPNQRKWGSRTFGEGVQNRVHKPLPAWKSDPEERRPNMGAFANQFPGGAPIFSPKAPKLLL